jgi:hypothetical protein
VTRGQAVGIDFACRSSREMGTAHPGEVARPWLGPSNFERSRLGPYRPIRATLSLHFLRFIL